jgi:hypothetical protein
MLSNALDLHSETTQTVSALEQTAPDWANHALLALAENEITLGEVLTRSDAANALYKAMQLKKSDMGLFTE